MAVYVVCIDSASWGIIDKIRMTEDLPNMSYFMENSAVSDIISTIHPATPQAMSSFLTGKTPGRHGVYSFSQRKRETYLFTPTSSTSIMSETLPEILSRKGVYGGYFFLPLLYPIRDFSGIAISGLGTPGFHSDWCRPASLKKRITEKYPHRFILETDTVNKTRENYIDHVVENIRVQSRIVRDLDAEHKFEVLTHVIGQTDRVQHFFWKEMDRNDPRHDPGVSDKIKNAIRDVYKEVDAALGYYRQKALGGHTVIIFSDHGVCPYYKDVYLNNFLKSIGLLSYLPGRGLKGSFEDKAKRYKRILPKRLKAAIKKIAPGGMADSIRSAGLNPGLSSIDFEKTQAFAEGYYGNIYINEKGRYPQGVVAPDNVGEVKDSIREALEGLADPETGKKAVVRIYDGRSLYPGPEAAQAPDLMIETDSYFHVKPNSNLKDGAIFGTGERWGEVSFPHTAEHAREGIFMLCAPAARPGRRGAPVRLEDIAPTMLYLLDREIPSDMTGRVRMELLNASDTLNRRVRYEPSCKKDLDDRTAISSEDEREIAENLKSLGYID